MTRFVIKKSDIVHNYDQIANHTHALVIPTLKAECYGLGAKAVLELLHTERGVTLFAVSRLEEALPLCNMGADILLLSCYHDDISVQKAVDRGIILSVDSLSLAKRISEYAKSKDTVARVHVKIDTGFGRFGFLPTSISDIKELYTLDGIKCEGIFSHFSNAFGKDTNITDKQFECFTELIHSLEDSGIDTGIRHIANSSAAVRDKKYHLDAVRIGSVLTGRLPMRSELSLNRVGVFRTQICDIRTLKKGSNVGYGNVFSLKKNTRVAVLCVGAADGVLIKKDYDTYRLIDILRYGFNIFKMLLKDNRLLVEINGQTTRTVGRVALTHTFADVTDIDCRCGDTAVIDISPLYVSSTVEREYV